MAVNIGYSALIACMSEIFLLTNLSIISRYFREMGRENLFTDGGGQGELIRVLIFVLLGIAVFSVSFLFLQRRTMRYMAEISQAMQNISEGDLNTAVEIIGDDEFSQMAESLNKLAENIRELMDKEREAERSKNELITNIAHDLRTPLTSIIGYLELLSNSRQTVTEPEIQKKYIDIAYTKAKRLEKLIEDLFGFTKMTYGKVSMKVGQVDIIKLLSQLLEEFYPSFADNNLTYELTSDVPAQMICADANLLARLFDNLINPVPATFFLHTARCCASRLPPDFPAYPSFPAAEFPVLIVSAEPKSPPGLHSAPFFGSVVFADHFVHHSNHIPWLVLIMYP